MMYIKSENGLFEDFSIFNFSWHTYFSIPTVDIVTRDVNDWLLID